MKYLVCLFSLGFACYGLHLLRLVVGSRCEGSEAKRITRQHERVKRTYVCVRLALHCECVHKRTGVGFEGVTYFTKIVLDKGN
jgi:hypothetical protein